MFQLLPLTGKSCDMATNNILKKSLISAKETPLIPYLAYRDFAC